MQRVLTAAFYHIKGCMGRKLTVWHIVAAVITVFVFFNEYLIYSFQTWTWSSLYLDSSQENDVVRILFVADPQLQGTQDESAIYGFITRWDADTYLSRTFRRAYHHTKPELVIFLGDLLDEGSFATDEDYTCYYKRFQEIFYTPPHVKRIYLSGDNDVGGEGWDRKEEWKISRFRQFFLRTRKQPSPVVNHKFLDFLTLDLKIYEPLSKDLTKRLKRMVDNSTAPYRILLDHFNLLNRDRTSLLPILQQTKASIAFTAHTHDANLLTCLDCREEVPKITKLQRFSAWHGTKKVMKDNTVYDLNLHDSVSIDEVMVPTASYRMGVPQMGYGSAIVDLQGHMKYTVLWLPSRYNQLFSYVYLLLALVLVLLGLCLGQMRRCLAGSMRHRTV